MQKSNPWCQHASVVRRNGSTPPPHGRCFCRVQPSRLNFVVTSELVNAVEKDTFVGHHVPKDTKVGNAAQYTRREDGSNEREQRSRRRSQEWA
jgi:hypothetical protein